MAAGPRIRREAGLDSRDAAAAPFRMASMSWLTSRCVMWLRTNLGSSTPQGWRERFLAGAWLAGVALLLALADRTTIAASALGWAFLILAGAFLLRNGAIRLFGPVLVHDLLC